MSVLSRSIFLISAFSLVSCRSATGPDVASVVGTYVLQSVSGRGPAVGTVVLTRNGDAERSVQGKLADGSLSAVYVTDGYFAFTRSGGLEIGLREGTGSTIYVFKPIVTWSAGILTLEYGDPGDGPNIIETYRRL